MIEVPSVKLNIEGPGVPMKQILVERGRFVVDLGKCISSQNHEKDVIFRRYVETRNIKRRDAKGSCR